MPWKAVYIRASSSLQQQTRTQMYLKTTCTQATLYRSIHAKGHLSFSDTCPDLYNCLSVLCALCLAVFGAAGHLPCTMQCWAASNTHYVVLGSF